MKPFIAVLLFMFIIGYSMAQDNKGKIYVETGVKVFGGVDYQNFMGKTGISFFQHNYEYELPNGEHENYESVNGFSYSIAPRVGYFVGDKLSTGLDLQYFNKNWWMDYHNFTGGVYARYYFLLKKFSPFIEIGGGLGKSKEIEDGTSPGGAEYQNITKEKLSYLNASAGASYKISEKFELSMAFKYQQTVQKFDEESNYSTNWYKKTSKEFVPFLSFSYYFN